MAYPEGPFETMREDLKASTSRPVTSRSDIFPKLVSLQRALHARGFAVLRVTGTGMLSKRRLVAEYENWPAAHGMGGEPFIAAYGETLLGHIETSLLPVLWSAEESDSFAEASDFVPFVMQLKPRVLAYSGIAFPVRLGAVGNGYVMFPITGAVDLPGEVISRPPVPISLENGAAIQGVSAVSTFELAGSLPTNQSKLAEILGVFMCEFLHESPH